MTIGLGGDDHGVLGMAGVVPRSKSSLDPWFTFRRYLRSMFAGCARP
ncbi:hypothetical protein P3102_27385 [Amycolatopsis sp. QT-25]|nr:hypothetical protein [Amycolatopsis sp. QT-25]WET77779.1 hypothetical protein P3102_27385 [Amycolatopsis sp. QT-25]